MAWTNLSVWDFVSFWHPQLHLRILFSVNILLTVKIYPFPPQKRVWHHQQPISIKAVFWILWNVYIRTRFYYSFLQQFLEDFITLTLEVVRLTATIKCLAWRVHWRRLTRRNFPPLSALEIPLVQQQCEPLVPTLLFTWVPQPLVLMFMISQRSAEGTGKAGKNHVQCIFLMCMFHKIQIMNSSQIP